MSVSTGTTFLEEVLAICTKKLKKKNVQQAYEKMLNIADHQRNENQSYNEKSLHTHYNAHYQKQQQRVTSGEAREKLILSCPVGRTVK